MATKGLLSDHSLALLLQESRWANAGLNQLVLSTPDPEEFRMYWTGLTVYRMGGLEFHKTFKTVLIQAQQKYGARFEPIHAVIQTTMDVIQSPRSYPFCLTPAEWIASCRTKFGGKIDGNTYKPPSLYGEALNIVLKMLVNAAVGAVESKFPGSDKAGPLITMLGGQAKDFATKGVSGMVIDKYLPPGNPLDDYNKAAVFKRYQIENQRRKLP